MKFCWSTLNVKDLDESVNFYTEIIGLDVNRRFESGDMEIAFLGKGETQIELIKEKNKDNINTGVDISWGFATENLDETLKLFEEKGVKVLSGVIQPNPFIKFVMISDPNGMTIQVVEVKR